MQQKSASQRLLWAQCDALQMGSGWDEEDALIFRGSWSRQNTAYLRKADTRPNITQPISVTGAPRGTTG